MPLYRYAHTTHTEMLTTPRGVCGVSSWQTEWKGAWSDSSPLWTPELKKELGHRDVDGACWASAPGAWVLGWCSPPCCVCRQMAHSGWRSRIVSSTVLQCFVLCSCVTLTAASCVQVLLRSLHPALQRSVLVHVRQAPASDGRGLDGCGSHVQAQDEGGVRNAPTDPAELPR